MMVKTSEAHTKMCPVNGFLPCAGEGCMWFLYKTSTAHQSIGGPNLLPPVPITKTDKEWGYCGH